MATNPYFVPSWLSKNKDQLLAGTSSGLAAGAANSQSTGGDFSFDRYAALKGAGSGALAGSSAGPVGAAIGAGIGAISAQIGQVSRINKNLRNLNTGVEATAYDAQGQPVYQGGNVTEALGNVSALSKGEQTVGKSSRLFKKIRKKKGQLQSSIQQAQGAYNTADQEARARQNQMEDYYQKANSNDRMYNLYRSQQ